MSNIQTYYMDSTSTGYINTLIKKLGRNFVPVVRDNPDNIVLRGPQGLDKSMCLVVSVDLHVRKPKLDGTPVVGKDVMLNFTLFDEKQNPKSILDETLSSPQLVETLETISVPGAEGMTPTVAFNKVLLGAFTRYGIPEVLRFNDLKNKFADTGFYINLLPGTENDDE